MPIPMIMMAVAGAKGLSTIAGGFQQRAANKAQALGAEMERDMALLRRTQLGADSRRNLLTISQNIDALRSARGASLDSPTGQAIGRRTVADGYADEARASLAEMIRAGAADQARRGFRQAASWSVPLAVLSSVGDFASAYSYGKSAFAPAPVKK